MCANSGEELKYYQWYVITNSFFITISKYFLLNFSCSRDATPLSHRKSDFDRNPRCLWLRLWRRIGTNLPHGGDESLGEHDVCQQDQGCAQLLGNKLASRREGGKFVNKKPFKWEEGVWLWVGDRIKMK